MSEHEDTTVYKVVMNHEEQYSIWPADRENALGWKDAAPPEPGEAIRFVKEHGLGCAICTSATPGKLVHNLRALGYKESDFGAVLTAVDVPQAKPFPYVYLEGARRLGVPIGDCVAFDDTINGVKAGLSSSAFTVAVGTTFAAEDFLAAGLKPDGYIRGIDELPEFFASRFPEQFGKLS